MIDKVLRIVPTKAEMNNPEFVLTREWLVTNGLGGYACGTVAGAATRRYHGLLTAALPNPLGRRMMFNHLAEQLSFPNGKIVRLGAEERGDGSLDLRDTGHLTEFRLEEGLPVWLFEFDGCVLEKRILLPHRQNTVHITYRILCGESTLHLRLIPSLHFRSHEAPVSEAHAGPYVLTAIEHRYEIAAGPQLPPLRLFLYGENPAFTLSGQTLPEILYRIEESRGYEARGVLWSPGYFQADLSAGKEATLIASTESWNAILSLPPPEAREAEHERRRRLLMAAHPEARTGVGGELVLASDQFIITPAGRVEDAARAHAAGDEVRTVIAGYHWFTDWGRDTMISLEGLTLTTGRRAEAGYILRTFAHYIRDGLIPNLFPEGQQNGLYHTADATLWFFHAIARYLDATEDHETLRLLVPRLKDIVAHHVRGTRFGIGVDPRDGLLHQGEQGYQLTWMDAKVGDWVVTPRRGKAVEINALWYSALRLLEGWVRQEENDAAAKPFSEQAEQARRSFNERFWYGDGGYLYDVVDGERGNDPACRPNQVLAIALPYPVLDRARWEPVMRVVEQELLTPVGLRSLSPKHPDYKPQYHGDLRARDAAYHQGTVWAWLIGPFVDAWVKLHPEGRRDARKFLEGFVGHLKEACIGSISEVFDAEPPYTPRGCVAQAWSVAEVLRCWVKTGKNEDQPGSAG